MNLYFNLYFSLYYLLIADSVSLDWPPTCVLLIWIIITCRGRNIEFQKLPVIMSDVHFPSLRAFLIEMLAWGHKCWCGGSGWTGNIRLPRLIGIVWLTVSVYRWRQVVILLIVRPPTHSSLSSDELTKFQKHGWHTFHSLFTIGRVLIRIPPIGHNFARGNGRFDIFLAPKLHDLRRWINSLDSGWLTIYLDDWIYART